ncbi:RAVE protein 1 C terminal-domain-containing protein [Infundibulicybe gibba]|nr:RAVE protein 1 C terminal-domain-containing protein [Infundibulicybe gibba]
MLALQQAHTGSPNTDLQHLVLPTRSLIIYPSAAGVVVLDAHSLTLVRVLAFWEAFPSVSHLTDHVICVAVDSGMKLIVAAMGVRVAAWSLSGVNHDMFRVHSTLVLPEHHIITTLDSKSGIIVSFVGRWLRVGLSVYTLILDNDLPTWSPKWMVSYVFDIQAIPHPRPIRSMSWRYSQASSRDDLTMYTITSDSTLRIFLPVLDLPQHLQLHAALDLYSIVPCSSKYPDQVESSVFWLDGEFTKNSFDAILAHQNDQEDACRRRIREIKEEGWDLFLRVLADRSIIITAVANIDCRPPTLLKHFTLQHTPPMNLPSLPSHLYLIPNKKQLSLVTSSPISTFELSLYPSLMPNLMDCSEILRLVRTPEGNGVGVIRRSGGDAWQMSENHSKLLLSGEWSTGDHVVILDGGRKFATYSASDNMLALCLPSQQTIPLPPIDSIFSIPSRHIGHEIIIGIALDSSIIQIDLSDIPSLTLLSHNRLPLPSNPKMILPVDPMAWGLSQSWAEHDVLLSISETGQLAFWVPENEEGTSSWRCTGKVTTGRKNIHKGRCSSMKKTALIVPEYQREELTIWDSKESEFASGLEYRGYFSEPINDLDWTSTPDMQSVLAVGFLHHVELLCQQRMTYFDEGPGWALCWKITIGNFIPYPIKDSIWLANGSLLVAAGHQMCLYGDRPAPTGESASEGLFEYVARQNGPLDDYHPQMLLQCLLWEKVELVKDIIVNLSRYVLLREEQPNRFVHKSVPVEFFLQKNQFSKHSPIAAKRYSGLFNNEQEDETIGSTEPGFSRPLVTRLIRSLELQPLSNLTRNEQAHLLVLIQTTLEIDEQRRSLDANGLRYLISMRSFYILNHRASTPNGLESKEPIRPQTGRRERLRYRDMVWAFHSESQDLLLNASTNACSGKMHWSDARALGIGIWLNSVESLKSQLEIIARNEYMAGDNRDPTACSLYYFALGKIKLVHGLWRQAAWHKEQAVMLKFLSNDFTDARWRTAALKNAYALLSKQRFEYAAAFFLLGGSLKDAVNVCIKQLGDVQLAVVLARVVEHSNEGPILQDILNKSVLRIALKDGNRWLGSWAFWLLHRRDLAVRILLTPLQEIAELLGIQVEGIGEPHYDDPSLALLFSQLRAKTLQAAKGTSEISGRAEFNFVLQMARVFCRMGCHVLALDILQSWSFERPSTARRSMFTLQPTMRRRSSMIIDMVIPSTVPTRTASPDPPARSLTKEPIKEEEGDLLSRKVGLGNLMKSAKQDVNVPEFDMSTFF